MTSHLRCSLLLATVTLFFTCKEAGATLNLTLEYKLREDAPVGSQVANIIQDSGLAVNYTSQQINKLRFSFSSTTDSISSSVLALLAINSTTGIIYVSRPIDRVTLCAYLDYCNALIKVVVRSPEDFQLVRVLVSIISINRHAPAFPSPRLELNVTDGTAPGTQWSLPEAADPDGGVNGVQSYQLLPVGGGGTVFGLLVTTLADGSRDVRLRLLTALDNMVTDYNLTLIATDAGSPPRNGTLNIYVRVSDVIDDAVRFDQATYDVTVSENVRVMTVVAQVTARSSNMAARIEYSLDDISIQQYGQMFAVSNSTGELYVVGLVDYEQQHDCLLTVVAVDRSSVTSLPVYARVHVYIRDVNDNAPTVTLNALTSSGQLVVLDGQSAGTFIAYITASDPDTGNGSVIACQVDSSMYFRLLGLGDADYKLLTNVVFQRSFPPTYHVTVTCHDYGVPVLSSSLSLDVTLIHSGPRFVSDVIETRAAAGDAVGTILTTLNTTGSDVGPETEVEYSMTFLSGFMDVLTIGRRSGDVTTRVMLTSDDVNKTLTYNVTATDHGLPTMAASTRLVVHVVNGGQLTTMSTTSTSRPQVVTSLPLASSSKTSLSPLMSTTTMGLVAANDVTSSGRDNVVIIASVVCASVVAIVTIVAIVVAIVCLKRRSKQATKNNNTTTTGGGGSGGGFVDQQLAVQRERDWSIHQPDYIIMSNDSDRSSISMAPPSEHDSHSSTCPLYPVQSNGHPRTAAGSSGANSPVVMETNPSLCSSPATVVDCHCLPLNGSSRQSRQIESRSPTKTPHHQIHFNDTNEIRWIVDQESDSGFSGSLTDSGRGLGDPVESSDQGLTKMYPYTVDSHNNAVCNNSPSRFAGSGSYSTTRAAQLRDVVNSNGRSGGQYGDVVSYPYSDQFNKPYAATVRSNGVNNAAVAPPVIIDRNNWRPPPGNSQSRTPPVCANFDTYV